MEKIPIRHIRSSNNEPTLSENFSIRDVRHMLAGNDMVQELHRHDFYYVLALKKGLGSHAIDFISYPVCNQSVCFMRPGQVHQLTLNAGSTGYLMQFKTDFYFPHDTISQQILRRASNKNFCQRDSKEFKKLFAILTSIFQEYNQQQENYQEVIKANLGIFFIELVRHRQNRESATNKKNTYAQDRLEEFFGLLEKDIATHKQVSHYADRLNLSSYQLNAITKETLGKTSSELINEHIILESKRYLLSTSNQITQVAYHLGYEDVSYFIRFFKKHTGHTPESFRNNFK